MGGIGIPPITTSTSSKVIIANRCYQVELHLRMVLTRRRPVRITPIFKYGPNICAAKLTNIHTSMQSLLL